MSEVENTPAVTVGANKDEIEAFLDALQQSNFNQAEKHFTDMLGDRVGTALDQARVKIAGQVYNEEEPEEAAAEEEPEEESSEEEEPEEE
jgi:hypothetical protein